MAKKRKQQNQNYKRKSVSAKTPNQKEFIKAIQSNQIVICEGLAGTGKTHIAVGMAVEALVTGQVKRIVVSRPAVEAGENLGFLPGDLDDKLSPYIRPIVDELIQYASYQEIAEWRNSGELEICPLAYMRGRNFHDTFVVADECQNASKKQLKMLLSRLGEGSKMVVVGDTTQSDLREHQSGDFRFIIKALSDVDNVAICSLHKQDVVRNPVVAAILDSIENYEKSLLTGGDIVI